MLKNGIIIVNKPEGFTSHDVIAKLRGILRERRLGHGGTLDPMATGVLPIFVRGATKASDFASAQSKTYVAKFRLGIETDTQDITGAVINEGKSDFSLEQVTEILGKFKGKIMQKPPMYSAIQIDGQRLYDLARQGIVKDVPEREIEVFDIKLLSFEDGEYEISLTVSKGTYVRTICHDIGLALGSFATMTNLVRVASGNFSIDNSYTLDDLQKLSDEGKVNDIIIEVDTIFEEYPRVELDEEGAKRASHGAHIFLRNTKGVPHSEKAISRVYYKDHFIMLGQTKTLDKGGYGLFCFKNFDLASVEDMLKG